MKMLPPSPGSVGPVGPWASWRCPPRSIESRKVPTTYWLPSSSTSALQGRSSPPPPAVRAHRPRYWSRVPTTTSPLPQAARSPSTTHFTRFAAPTCLTTCLIGLLAKQNVDVAQMNRAAETAPEAIAPLLGGIGASKTDQRLDRNHLSLLFERADRELPLVPFRQRQRAPGCAGQ